MLKAVIFDRDYTIFDATKSNYQTVCHVLEARRLPRVDQKRFSLISVRSRSDLEFWRLLLKHVGSPDVDALDLEQAFRRDYSHFLGRSFPYPGLGDMLRRLHRLALRVAVVSALPGTEETRGLLSKWNLSKFVGTIVTAEDVKHKVPIYTASHFRRKLWAVKVALAHLKARPRSSMMVGDTTTDVKVGRRLKMVTVGLARTSWHAQRILKEEPEFLVEGIQYLPEIVRGLRLSHR